MKSELLIKLEKFFEMPLKDIIDKLHHDDKISVNELSKRSGITRQSITNFALKAGLKIRTVKEATRLTKNKGKKHFMWGKTKDNCDRCMTASLRMKANNPINSIEAATKRAVTISKTFRENLYIQEEIFKEILEKNKVKFEMQTPFGPYNLDFFIRDMDLAIEIDSTQNWWIDRKKAAKKRDKYMLKTHRIETLRIDKRLLANELVILNILYAYNVIR